MRSAKPNTGRPLRSDSGFPDWLFWTILIAVFVTGLYYVWYMLPLLFYIPY